MPRMSDATLQMCLVKVVQRVLELDTFSSPRLHSCVASGLWDKGRAPLKEKARFPGRFRAYNMGILACRSAAFKKRRGEKLPLRNKRNRCCPRLLEILCNPGSNFHMKKIFLASACVIALSASGALAQSQPTSGASSE